MLFALQCRSDVKGANTVDVLRGDIFYIRKVGMTEGNEQDAGRPAIIVSNDIGNQHANIVEVVYLTTQEKKSLPTHVDIICKVPSVALCEQVCTVSKDRLGDLISNCTVGEMKEIDKALMISLGIEAEEHIPMTEELVHDQIMALEKGIDQRNAQIKQLEHELSKAREQQRKDESKEDVNAAINYAALMGERNIYKTMYEQLLEKVMSQKGC